MTNEPTSPSAPSWINVDAILSPEALAEGIRAGRRIREGLKAIEGDIKRGAIVMAAVDAATEPFSDTTIDAHELIDHVTGLLELDETLAGLVDIADHAIRHSRKEPVTLPLTLEALGVEPLPDLPPSVYDHGPDGVEDAARAVVDGDPVLSRWVASALAGINPGMLASLAGMNAVAETHLDALRGLAARWLDLAKDVEAAIPATPCEFSSDEADAVGIVIGEATGVGRAWAICSDLGDIEKAGTEAWVEAATPKLDAAYGQKAAGQ